jgi:SAM-dependent methyltransferase
MEPAQVDAYRRLSEIYDLGWGPWSQQYVQVLADWLEQEGLGSAQVLDLGCGSGLVAGGLAALGHQVVGLDSSPAMIERARAAELSGARFDVQDMAQCTWPHPFDLVSCTFDAFNYLLTETRVESFFAHVARLLAPGGLLVFDANTDRLYAAHHSGTHAREVGGQRFTQACHYDAQTRLASTVFTFDDGATERHLQRAWDLSDLRAPLEQAGFQVVAAMADVVGEPYRDNSERLLCVARKSA